MATLNVPCFRYLGQDLISPLTVEDSMGEQFVRCPVRERMYRVTPEERVRQALIWFLLEGSNRAASLGEHLLDGDFTHVVIDPSPQLNAPFIPIPHVIQTLQDAV